LSYVGIFPDLRLQIFFITFIIGYQIRRVT